MQRPFCYVANGRLHTPEQPAPIDAVKRSAKTVALSELQAAQTALKEYPDVLRTPLLKDWPLCEGQHHVSLKLESLQTTGSFKVRAKLRAQGRACPRPQDNGRRSSRRAQGPRAGH